MFKFNFDTIQKRIFYDSTTPIELYLKLRDIFPKTSLLEITEQPNIVSSIFCINPISEFILEDNIVRILYPNGVNKQIFLKKTLDLPILIDEFFNTFHQNSFHDYNKNSSSYFSNFILSHNYSGFYGYISYDSIQYFENIKFKQKITNNYYDLPKARFTFYGNLIIFYSFYNEMFLIEHEFTNLKKTSNDQLIKILNKKIVSHFTFKTAAESCTSNVTDQEYQDMVSQGIKSCLRGDVFQIVLSRQFQQQFKGDEFNVYRAIRFINPSPYSFYFDYGNYKVFGTSPETQLIIDERYAYIYPIAGTIKRLKNDSQNNKLKIELLNDPKENSEHIMLVDLARNDLSKHSYNVKVDQFKKIQEFSHVFHIISKVSGKLEKHISIIKILGDTFPAGTLSGAPKYKAMELIDQIENQNRGIYGGAIGFFGLNNSYLNTAIIIRSFISKNNVLFFQAGAGIVSDSVEQKELEEVKNKLMALFQAIKLATYINNYRKY
ncbi:anthranilate synthase component I family protein [Blattabacterium cuenoti]|uniref:anthranilate synthase component I family protein n=1 Tax=Blattabacterium cuenoti TaxID=1653831 RepID=UPI00163BF284|nr:anthranilate synthase component I family protein [Blattabacterium cuenoti]